MEILIKLLMWLPSIEKGLRKLLEEKDKYYAKELINKLLKDEKYTKRSLSIIRKKIWLSKERTKDILLSCWAERFEWKDGKELWGLTKRNYKK